MGLITHQDRIALVYQNWSRGKYKIAYNLMESYVADEHQANSDLQKLVQKIKDYETQVDVVRDKISAHRYNKDTPSQEDKEAFAELMMQLRAYRNQLAIILDHMKKLLG